MKIYLRASINGERLHNLGVLSIESKRAKALNLDSCVNRWVKNKKEKQKKKEKENEEYSCCNVKFNCENTD